MKLLYFSVHGTLEWQELTLFTELGHECFSCGEYIYPDVQPEEAYLRKRPGVAGMQSHPDLAPYAINYPSTNVPQELVDWADVIMVMHDPMVIIQNWQKFKNKPTIWRSIGQSTPTVENMLRPLRYEGLKIVRMSPMEANIIGYMGEDAIIRFYGDPAELTNWTGHEKRVINVTQSLKGRRVFCHFDQIMQMMEGYPSLVYGSGNSDLGSLNGGELPYDLLKGALRDNRVFVYTGTWPSPYTLSLIDAMMTGIPVIAIGQKLAEEIVPEPDRIHFYEIPDIIKNTENGFYSDTINDLRFYVKAMLDDQDYATRIGKEGRKTAMRVWSKEKIKKEWEDFFETL